MKVDIPQWILKAKQLMRGVWNLNDQQAPAYVAHNWFYSEAGLDALARFLDRVVYAELKRDNGMCLLAERIYMLEVEIAARRAGWCLELAGDGSLLTQHS